LSSQPEQKCPFCRRPWEFKQAEALPSIASINVAPVAIAPAARGPPQNQ
jgi:hypothetical protein